MFIAFISPKSFPPEKLTLNFPKALISSTGSSERSSVSGPMNTTTLQFTDSRQLPSTLKTQAISERTAAVRLQSHSQTKLIRSTTKNQANANAAQKTPSSKSATASTWRTRSDNVNARSGPGLDTNIIFKMNY